MMKNFFSDTLLSSTNDIIIITVICAMYKFPYGCVYKAVGIYDNQMKVNVLTKAPLIKISEEINGLLI